MSYSTGDANIHTGTPAESVPLVQTGIPDTTGSDLRADKHADIDANKSTFESAIVGSDLDADNFADFVAALSQVDA
jgi:hypothetical protein